MNGYLLDTHAWLWVILRSDEQVSKTFFADVEDWQRRRQVYLSPFSCWEIALLVAAQQLRLDSPIESLWERDTSPGGFMIAPLTPSVLIRSNQLPGEIQRDPADRILAATAREQNLTLVTRDGRLLDYAKHGHLKARKP